MGLNKTVLVTVSPVTACKLHTNYLTDYCRVSVIKGGTPLDLFLDPVDTLIDEIHNP